MTNGSSQGQWMLHDLPGLVLIRSKSPKRWHFQVIRLEDPMPEATAERLKQVWGDAFTPHQEVLRLRAEGCLYKPFSSRAAALSFLESKLGKRPDAVLQELL